MIQIVAHITTWMLFWGVVRWAFDISGYLGICILYFFVQLVCWWNLRWEAPHEP